MSLLNVNKIAPQSGTAFTLGDSGDTFTVPSGATLTVAGTFTQTGAQTFDGGVEIDNFTINGSEIDLSSGDMTLDVAGDIILDADGGEVLFHDATTAMGHISMASSNITLKSLVSDKDIIFQGNDGGAAITALTLDMSAAGKATFNDGVVATTVVGSGAAQFATAGIGAAKDLGTGLHIKTSDSGASANSLADELVVESSGTDVGASFLCATNGATRINFADSGDNDVGQIKYGHDTDSLFIKTAGVNHLVIDGAGHVTMPKQPCFFVYKSGNQAGGSGTADITFDTERFDLNADFGSNVFTAPVTGKYSFQAMVGHVNAQAGGNVSVYLQPSNAEIRAYRNDSDSGTSNYQSASISTVIDMDANDTCKLQFNSSSDNDFIIESSTYRTYFSGYLVA